MTGQRIVWAAVALAIVRPFLPVTTLNCPLWDVWVTDQGGRPVPGITVWLTYQNYSLEEGSHKIDAITDKEGHVRFGPRTLTVPLWWRVAMTVWSAEAGVHASLGPHAYVSASGRGLEGGAVDARGYVVDWTGEPYHMQSKIVVRPEKPW